MGADKENLFDNQELLLVSDNFPYTFMFDSGVIF